MLGNAFPPFALINKCAQQIRQVGSMVIIVAPVWRAQPWFTALLELLADYPHLLPVHPDLMRVPCIQQKTSSAKPSTSRMEGLREQHANTGF